jgi:hypothetical protein
MMIYMVARRRTEAFSESAFAELLDDEARAVRALYAEQHVRAAYSRQDVLGAVLVWEAASVAEAEGLAQRLPLAARGMLELTWIPVQGYRGFGP